MPVLPFDITDNNGEFMVKWIDIPSVTLIRPMFGNSIQEFINTGCRVTESDERFLLQRASSYSAVEPAGFIFHTSRCGSTVLSNALQLLPDSLVISEAGAINSILKMLAEGQHGDKTLKAMIVAFITLWGSEHQETPVAIFIKFSSWNILLAKIILELWPMVPVAFAFREPLAIVNSLLVSPPQWISFLKEQSLFFKRLVVDTEYIFDDNEFIDLLLWFIKQLYLSGVQLADALFIDYNADSRNNILRLFNKFQLKATEVQFERIFAATSYYSKDPSGQKAFTGEQYREQFAIREPHLTLINNDLLPPYRLLQSRL